jgi:hypothetical protein
MPSTDLYVRAGAAEETLVEDAFDSGGWMGRRGAYGIGLAAAVGAGALGGTHPLYYR